MAHALNLDAHIPREDFEIEADRPPASSKPAQALKMIELEEGSMAYLSLRKPDFQRETADWVPEMVVDLVTSLGAGRLWSWQTVDRVLCKRDSARASERGREVPRA